MASKLFFVFIFTIFHVPEFSVAQYANAQNELLEYLFPENDTKKEHLLPVLNYSDAVTVDFRITLIKIKDVNAKEQTIQVHVWVTQSWVNPFLKWDNNSKFERIKSINVKPSLVWIPDIILYNNVDEQDRTGGGEETYKTLIKLYSNGTSIWSSPALFKAICEIDVSYFPLDQQTCRLKFGSWTYDSKKLKLVTKQKAKFPTPDFIKNGEWAITKVETKANDRVYHKESQDSYMDVTMTIAMKRQYLDYVINLVIPCLMISSMTFLGFILPPESGERVGLSITVLLAMTVFQQLTSEIMPSYGFPLLGQYYFATIVEIGAALLITTIILNFYHRTNRHMPRWLRVLLLDWLSRVVFLHESAEKCNKSRRKTIKRGIRENVDAVVNNGYALGEHPLDADVVGATRTQRHENGRSDNDESQTKPAGDRNVLKLTLGSIGSELNSQTVQNERGLFTDETGAAVSEEEMRMRHQQWTLAAKVLDRFFLWSSGFIGIATFLGIFLSGPGLWDNSIEMKL
ncbi:neuronal acetylcholine receptor subunit alpha-9-like [Dendronephthya gigantea]|uniref:neuronal acetylcholine receptor subunit alpha-9-like n=1 Tax=Dendronephthya gigantea TaxID=151771 RepID=UPI0010695FDC|nr:neuronal acetylcholine receptor subunit alpha-9-like [Dendronephthya gigantea]XP_028396655.1 neuronal acetylcholine receptor subunit alpha-9-like [Dendronephthya gigantea]